MIMCVRVLVRPSGSNLSSRGRNYFVLFENKKYIHSNISFSRSSKQTQTTLLSIQNHFALQKQQKKILCKDSMIRYFVRIP